MGLIKLTPDLLDFDVTTLASPECLFDILKARREILDRIHNARKVEGSHLRHTASALECRHYLDLDKNEKDPKKKLTPWQRCDLAGREKIALAECEHCDHLTEQYRLEVQALLVHLNNLGIPTDGLY